MAKPAEFEIPTGLQELARQFEEWRSSHSGRRPIPEALWMRAADLAREHGVFRTSKVLRLDYSKLKRQMELAQANGHRASSAPPPAFVELLAPQTTAGCECVIEVEGSRGPHAHRVERDDVPGSVRIEPGSLGAGRLIQIAPQIRILVAVEPIDARKGIDSLAQLCREKLSADPFSGWLFIFRSRRGTSIKPLTFDGQGFWLATKRLSKGRFRWRPTGSEAARVLRPHQAQLLLAAANPETEAPPEWRRITA